MKSANIEIKLRYTWDQLAEYHFDVVRDTEREAIMQNGWMYWKRGQSGFIRRKEANEIIPFRFHRIIDNTLEITL